MTHTQPRGFRRHIRVVAATALAGATALSLVACGANEGEADVGEQADQLTELLGLASDDELADGETVQLGAALTLSGPSAANGESMQQAIELAIDQIAAAGGPTIELVAKDIGGPDPVRAQQAATELAEAGVPAKITTFGDGFGAMLQSTDENQILSLDGVGGAQVFTQGVQYFYGTREVAPADAVPGTLEWLKQTDPDAQSVGLVGVDLGPFNDPIKADIVAKIEDAGLEFNGLWETVPPTSQDFASLVNKVQSNEPDLLIVAMGGGAPGAFVSQATAAGLDTLMVGIEFTQDAVAASKGVFDRDGFHFAMDYFDPETPANPLAELFVQSYEEAYGEKPDFYAANAYEETLMIWELARRVVADGGDLSDGAAFRAALESDPEFASVYGGSDDEAGTLVLDLETHGVATRPMGVYEYKNGKVTPLATFDIGAENFSIQ
jgi:branched-chain amino acid transport system substrate-binding protein